MKVKIRQARIEDNGAIARVQVDSYQTAYAGILPVPYLAHFTYQEEEQDWRDLLTSNRSDILYVAETDEGEIVGYALARAEGDKEAKYESELVAMHVRSSYQRQGLGRRLIAAVAGRLRQRTDLRCAVDHGDEPDQPGHGTASGSTRRRRFHLPDPRYRPVARRPEMEPEG